jgi:hypothetical protein
MNFNGEFGQEKSSAKADLMATMPAAPAPMRLRLSIDEIIQFNEKETYPVASKDSQQSCCFLE